MAKVEKALIIAAGRGLRMNRHTEDIPKCLMPFGNSTIIGTILSSLQAVGIKNIVIVTGYKEQMIRDALGTGDEFDVKVEYVFNPEWKKKNGISVLAARNNFSRDEHFLLMMSDHIFSRQMLQAIVDVELREGEMVLAVDQKHDKIFDIDDAMKVVVDGVQIKNIGKELAEYNGVDCGLFKCTPAVFSALERSITDGDCSLSDGCLELISENKFKALNFSDAEWVDIDTPEAFEYANKKFNIPVSPK